MGVKVVAIYVGRVTGLIRQPDQSEIEPTAQRRSKAGRDVEGVGGIRAEIAVGADDTRRRLDRRRCTRAEGLINGHARAEDIEAWQKRPELTVSRINGNAVIPRETDCQTVFSVKKRISKFRLEAGADGIRAGRRDVDFAECRPGWQDGGRHLVAFRIKQHVVGKEVVAFEAEKVAVVGAGRNVSQVAVGEMLGEMPIVNVAGEQLQSGRLVGPRELNQLRLVVDRLRNSKGVSYILGEQLYRRRPGGANDTV